MDDSHAEHQYKCHFIRQMSVVQWQYVIRIGQNAIAEPFGSTIDHRLFILSIHKVPWIAVDENTKQYISIYIYTS